MKNFMNAGRDNVWGDFMSKNPEEAMDFLSYFTKSKLFRTLTISQSLLHHQSFEHMVEECPTIPAAREMFGEQANLIGQWKPNSNAPYGNTYNSSWRNHPNFAWKPRPNPYQSPAQSSQQSQGQSSVEQALISLSKVMGDFVSEQKSINSQLNQKIDNVESTLNKNIDGMHNELSQKLTTSNISSQGSQI
ncbi:hypothetical protein AAG906_016065 [Vitis piasezkii]